MRISTAVQARALTLVASMGTAPSANAAPAIRITENKSGRRVDRCNDSGGGSAAA